MYLELAKSVDTIRSAHGLSAEDVSFHFGRGTIGNRTEQRLGQAFKQALSQQGKQAFKVLTGKSYGGIDTLAVLQKIDQGKGPISSAELGEIELLILLDATAPGPVVRPLLDKSKSDLRRSQFRRSESWRLRVPSFVKNVISVSKMLRLRWGGHFEVFSQFQRRTCGIGWSTARPIRVDNIATMTRSCRASAARKAVKVGVGANVCKHGKIWNGTSAWRN